MQLRISETVHHLPYAADGVGDEPRPAIQIKLKHTVSRLPCVTSPVSSFIAEALNRPPEVSAIACASVTETAAEKLVSLTRRTAMDLAGLSRDAPRTDPMHRERHDRFVAIMVYGKKRSFDEAMETVTALVDDTW